MTYSRNCDTEQPFIMVIFENPWQSQLLSSINDIGVSRLVFTQSTACGTNTLTDCAITAADVCVCIKSK